FEISGVERGLFVATLIRREESVSERSEDEHLPCHPCVQVMRNSNAQVSEWPRDAYSLILGDLTMSPFWSVG
ncbi:unnamed protein product, partial [Musa textilis]